MEAFIRGLQSGRFLKDLMDSLPFTLEDLMGRAESFDMMNVKRGREQESDCILELDGEVKGKHRSAGAGVMLHDVDGSL
ncbi:hypothetical protein Tco_1443451, partial [Tanacetum coccineum]